MIEQKVAESRTKRGRVMKINGAADVLAVFIATGFGAGLIPLAPGTFGSLVGLGIAYGLIVNLRFETVALQNALLLALSGEVPTHDAQAIRINGTAIGNLDAKARRLKGLASVPEERNGHAAVPDLSLADNTLLTARQRIGLVANGFIRSGRSRDYANKIIQRFGVKANGVSAPARSLSGGNLQKFIMGREILQTPTALVVSQPTWGVDAGAAAAIHQALVDLAAQDAAIIVISQDLDELLTLCDRLAVINEGKLSAPLDVAGVSIEKIGLLMGGVHGEAPHGAAAAQTLEAQHVPA